MVDAMGSNRGKRGLEGEEGGWDEGLSLILSFRITKVLFTEKLLRKSMIYEQGVGRTV
jgi:hypothetical protein